MKVIINLLIVFCFSFVSCQKDQVKEFNNRSVMISKSGGNIIYQESVKNKIIYQKGNNIILYNLGKEIILYSDTSHYEMREYNADFLYDGNVIINSFDSENVLLSEEIKHSHYKNFNECNVKCINGDFLFIDDYLICVENPNIVYNRLFFRDRLDTKGNLVIYIIGDFTKYPNNDYTFKLANPMDFYRGGCNFTWEVIIDRKGKIISKADEISTYGTNIPIEDLTDINTVETKYMPLIDLSIFINENIE